MRKKIKNSTKTKILVGVMGVTAVAMIVGPCLSALAADETEFTTEVKPETDNSDDKDIAGIWYMKDYGLIAQFDFAEDGTYTMAYENDPGETGTWILEDGNNVVLDKGSDNEMTLEYDGETMFINYGDGDNSEKLELIRSIPEEEKEAARKTGVKDEDFDGVWKVNKIAYGSFVAPVNLFGSEYIYVKLDGNSLYMYTPDSEDSGQLAIELDKRELNDDILTLDYSYTIDASDYQTAEVLDEEDLQATVHCEMELLEDGTAKIKEFDEEVKTGEDETESETESESEPESESESETLYSDIDFSSVVMYMEKSTEKDMEKDIEAIIATRDEETESEEENSMTETETENYTEEE